MSAAAAIAAPPDLRAPLLYSIALHALLFGSVTVSVLFSHRGETWGGPGGGDGAVTVGLVGSLSGVPLPQPATITPSRVVDTTKGLYKEEQRPPEPPEEAQHIPVFSRERTPRVVSHRSRVFENSVPPPENAVPYGQGGAPALPYTSFSMAGGVQGGLGMNGPGGGNFGARYSWYVEAVRRRISENWLVSTVDSGVREAPRVTVSFQILRDGRITNIQVQQSSGNASVDNSARRAVLGSNPLPPLPSDYSGSTVNVEFWFDFHR
jgi:periplasmic protein TonB